MTVTRTPDLYIPLHSSEANAILFHENSHDLPKRLSEDNETRSLSLWFPADLDYCLKLYQVVEKVRTWQLSLHPFFRPRGTFRALILNTTGLPFFDNPVEGLEAGFLDALVAGEDCWCPYSDWLQDNDQARATRLLFCLGRLA